MTELPPMATGGAPALGLALLNLLLSMLPDLVARNWQAVRSFGPGGVTVFNRIALSHPAALLPSCEHWQAVREHTHRAADTMLPYLAPKSCPRAFFISCLDSATEWLNTC